MDSKTFAEQRQDLVAELRREGIVSETVLRAMLAIPRELFVLPDYEADAYRNSALPIGSGQTISQPFIVAEMAEALFLKPDDRVLEVGTGSGYMAAVLSRLASEVFTVERIPELARTAADRLHRLGYSNVHVLLGDGTRGWPEQAPFDAMVISAGGPHVPRALIDQLRVGGRLVIPLGESEDVQELTRLTRREDGLLEREDLGGVRFVPLVPDAT